MLNINRRLVSKEYLEEHYVKQDKSMHQIALELNCTPKVIARLLKLYDIPQNINKTSKYHTKDWTGHIFGRMKIINRNPRQKRYQSYWDCECVVCGTKTVAAIKDLRKNAKNGTFGCRKCSRSRTENAGWTGYQDIKGEFWRTIFNCAIKRNLVFNITIEYAWELFLKQDKKCALTKIPLILYANSKDRTASLDRIDNAKGYIEGNVQWLLKDVNYMKWTLPNDYFIELCIKIAENQKSRKLIPSDFMLI